MKIYADNAATTRVSDTALAAMTPCFQEIYGNPSSLHTPGQRAAENGVVNLPLPPVEHIPHTPGGTAAVQLPEEPAAALSAQPQPAKFPGLRAVGQGPARPPAEVGGAAGFVKKAIRQVLEQPPQGG